MSAPLIDYVLWCMPIILGALLVWSGFSLKDKNAKLVVRILFGIVGAWLVYVGVRHLMVGSAT